MALTKQAIAERIQEQLGFPKNQSVEITEALLELVKTSLEAGEDVLVSGFGKFCVKEKAERKGRNQRRGRMPFCPPAGSSRSNVPGSCGTRRTGADMCGRFVGFTAAKVLQKLFPIDVIDAEMTPNYNVAPTQEILAIVRYDNQNHLEKLHWGLVPFWAKDTSIGNRMINARSETAATKPSFRNAFKNRRCLILADGFFEWKGEPGKKQPMFITLPDGKPFAFAGHWETWDNQGKEPPPYHSATILTREASESVMPINNRMPVISKPKAFDRWLDRGNQDVRLLQDLIQKEVYQKLKSVPVSKQVNSAKVNRQENIRPVEIK